MKLICGDCLEEMRKMPDEIIDLTITSPPYDNLRTYNGYSFNFENIAKELYRITKKGGIVVWVIGDQTINGSETGTSFKQALYFKEIGFNLHDTMIWRKQTFTDTGSLKTRYGNVFEYMFVLSKSKPKTFNPIKDRENKTYGRKKTGTIILKDGTSKEVSSKGKNIRRFSQRFNVWDINTCISNKERTKHPAQFPEQLVKDHILSWSNEGDLILDPFMGSGTTGKMCKLLNRDFIGIEISDEYFNIAKERINNLESKGE